MNELELKSSGVQFEVAEIHEKLFIVRNKNNKSVIGYINQAPSDGWIWFIASEVSSKTFNNIEDTIENLVQVFISYKMDQMTNKLNKNI